MFRTTLKGLLARKGRLFMTALAVTLGVSFMAGTLVLTDTIGKTFDDLFADVYKDTDAVVRAKAAFEGPQGIGAQRGRVDSSLVATVQAVDGVRAAEGEIFGYARLVGADGKAVGNPEMGAPTVGVNWPANPAFNPFRLQEGTEPRTGDEVVIDA
ncbi:MAG TPA: ABC transporter permease, partial [Acidimicrobiales bacterium]|nr:ABC transporter permease [Acidimicrobiales bacterium]